MNFATNYNNRTYGLDVFRSIAIILVVHIHGLYMLNNTILEGIPWINIIDGVELFFVLSGFLIGSILIKTIDKNNYKLNIKTILHFWKRRWFRTLPNYYLILFLNIIFVYFNIIDGDINQFSYKFFIFTQNFFNPLTDFFWESWSLTIEEWFYIILPICLLIVLKMIPKKKGILIVIITLMALPLCYRIMQSNKIVNYFWWDVEFRKVVVMRLDTIIYGVLAAYIKYYYYDIWKKHTKLLFIIGLIAALIIPNIPKDPNSFFAKTFYFNLTTISATLLLPYADSIKKFKSSIGKIITHISLISYSMYLINLALISQVMAKNFPITSPTEGFIKYIIYWLIVITGSTLLYFFFEKPIMELREKKAKVSS